METGASYKLLSEFRSIACPVECVEASVPYSFLSNEKWRRGDGLSRVQ